MIMLKTTLVASTIALATVLAMPGASLAEQHGGMHDRGADAFKRADKDNDGTLDKEEAKAMPNVAKNFDAIDTDKDGTVSLDEIHSFMKTHHQGGMGGKGSAAFKRADKDSDGTLDKEEAKAMPNVAKNFDAIDADKDGTVSMEEIHNFMMKEHHQGDMHQQ
jgi:Ca2+-binding EF-hand superfamily protein